MVIFKSIVSIEPLQLKPTALQRLAYNLENKTEYLPPDLPPEVAQYNNLTPRSLDEILMDLEDENTDNITLLEWVYCIYAKQEWDSEHSSEQRLATSRLVWENAIGNDMLKQRLCSRLAYYYDGNKKVLAPSFVETFSTLSDVVGKYDLAVNILHRLKQRDPLLPLAQLSLAEELTPKNLFITAQLPSNLSIINDVLEYVVTAFSQSKLQQNKTNWLVQCLEDMTVEQEISAVETLLKNVSAEIGGQFPNLVTWLQNNYGSRTTASKWNRLSSEGKSALRQWFGAANYRDFQRLVDIILQRLPLPDWEQNQLDSRKYFWEHYSDQFQRIRILLPQSSVNAVGNELKQDVDILQDDGSDETEVCIFDFGDWFVVEFFRGSGSETRIFNRHQYPNIEQELFESSQLSVKRLRALGGKVHDHKYLWQIYCERWLRERRIVPNPGTTYFKRRNKHNPNQPYRDPYDPQKGLREPDADKQSKRKEVLRRWQREIEQLEKEAEAAFPPPKLPSQFQCIQTLSDHSELISSLAVSPDGDTLFSGSGDKTIKVWQKHENQWHCQQTLQGHSDWVRCLMMNFQGDTLFSGSDDKTIRVWQLQGDQWQSVQTLQGHSDCVVSLMINPQGDTLFSGSGDKTIKVWQLQDNQWHCQQTLQDHSGWVVSLIMNPQGDTLFSGSHDKTIKVWQLQGNQWQCVQTLQSHSDWVVSLMINPQGDILFSGSGDKTIKVWQLQDNQWHCQQTLQDHSGWVVSLIMNPQGNTLFSGSGDKTIKVWRIS